MPSPNPRILIIDDEERITATISRYFRSEGYDVSIAHSGSEGLEIMQRKPTDIVITDIKMDEMSGLELLGHIRKAFPHIEVIIMSGHAEIEYAIEALRRDAFDYLRKPVDLEELQIIVERALRQRDAERRFREVQEQLYHAQKMESIGTLAGGVAHEFNNLMSGIVGYCDMAIKHEDNEELIRKALELSLSAAKRAAVIAGDLLRFAQREQHRRVISDLNQVMEDTLNLIRSDYEREKIELSVDYSAIPNAKVDEAQFQQVFLNLLVNSRKAILSSETKHGVIKIRTWVEDDRIIIEIADNGPGIPEDKKARVFEPFFSTWGLLGGGESKNSTGLGLSVVDGIVQGHGGEICLEDAPGGGTSIKLFIPAVGQEHEAKQRILLCDDEAMVRRIMRKVLEHSGFDVEEAECGGQAIEMIKKRDYSVMFLDQLMPDMDGLETLDKMSKLNLDLPVIMVTAMIDKKLARDAVMRGARECVFKPVNNEKLLFLAQKYSGSREWLATAEDKEVSKAMTGKSILVIDANPVIRDIYSLILDREGFRVTTSSGAEEAYAETEDHYFDLIIIDPITRDSAGEAAIQMIRANNPYTPILIATGHATSDILRTSLKAGASRVIQKPVNPSALVNEVIHFIGLYESAMPRDM